MVGKIRPGTFVKTQRMRSRIFLPIHKEESNHKQAAVRTSAINFGSSSPTIQADKRQATNTLFSVRYFSARYCIEVLFCIGE